MADPRESFDWGGIRNRRGMGAKSAVSGTTRTWQPNRVVQYTAMGKVEKPPPLDQPSGTLVASITVDTSASVGTQSPRITGTELVGSYNWLDSKIPTILIPGAPPKWTPLRGGVQLKEDAGDYFREPNSARWPKYPIEPAIRAVFDRNPKFNGKTINIVTCAGMMGCLFKFASSAEWEFQCFVHRVGDTLFLVRKERTPKELIQGVYGYGHTFPEAYTSWHKSVKGSATNQRIIRYEFGGLTFLVRFEADGYLGGMIGIEVKTQEKKTPTSQKGLSDMDVLSQNTESVTIGKIGSGNTATLKLQHAGFDVPQSAVFDVKTRIRRREISMPESLPRLWARQIPNFVVGYHDDGFFDRDHILVMPMKERIDAWEMENEKVLLRLTKVFESLIKSVKESEVKNLLVHRAKDGPLELWETKESRRPAMTRALEAKWKGCGEVINNSSDDDDDDGNEYLLF
ncbi:uncharacterized protein BDCG_06854 [Blastomyces dermatitidis ER-3]|uniref:Geranylgeranyl pyrophosphate synthetase n=3 Tax=Blastomyces TaxID=229219 RepID=A0A179V031_BLAGS|nr:uncharacterized protein BDBG_08624 [Blastomyces gilchristii SLH14081]XP_045278212.1 uncharacterized protein BDCG_06854 [Blastomyces dermatitidis ER-3]EEQ91734.2 hypothetical protein BDCG_06854 [Blastomyces dermatitidis ER-3]EGE82958.1 hypothetical protein BDDG_05902 [Blastomyces dermatitidis ATCC 18188]OAT13423.1 hypothetical protein BDBG_08624 [Blastomyces gilchristii SLH14081]